MSDRSTAEKIHRLDDTKNASPVRMVSPTAPSIPAATQEQHAQSNDVTEMEVVSSSSTSPQGATPSYDELLQISLGKFDDVDVQTIAKFNRLQHSGERLFEPLIRDPQIRQLMNSLAMIDTAAGESDEDEDEWEDENEGTEMEALSRAQAQWNRLRPEKKHMVLEIMHNTATVLLSKYAQAEGSQGVERARPAAQPPATGLFTANFDWEKLPPALKTVYDKQGHRQEVIDGNTFWKFLTLCTAITTSQDDSAFESYRVTREDEEGEEEEEGMTAEQFMMMLEAFVKKEKGKSAEQSGSKADVTEGEENREDKDEDLDDEAMLEALVKRLQGASGNDAGVQMLMQLMGGAGGMQAAPVPEADVRAKKMEQFLSERRNDPDRQHIADIWDQILKPELTANQQSTENKSFSKSFGIFERLREWRKKRKEEKHVHSHKCHHC